MIKLKTLSITLLLMLTLGFTALGAETSSPPCPAPDPGETSSPPCSDPGTAPTDGDAQSSSVAAPSEILAYGIDTAVELTREALSFW